MAADDDLVNSDDIDDEGVGPQRRAGLRPDELDPRERQPAVDRHAVGTPGGGMAGGGLAGTNTGDGAPANAYLDEAMGSGIHDTADEDEEENQGYSGPSGGSVGGTPAGKRSRGGNIHRGLAPGDDPGDGNTIGRNPRPR